MMISCNFLRTGFQDAKYALAIMILECSLLVDKYYGIQILIPHNKNKEFMISTTIPAVVIRFKFIITT